MPKGQKKSKGVPELYDEVKKRVNLSLTPTAIAGLDRLSQELNLSRSELVEQIGRGSIPIAEQKSLSEEFIISPIQSLPITECTGLPEAMGAFLVTDYAQFAYVGSSTNLKKRFEDLSFLEQINQFKSNVAVDNLKSQLEVLWIECDRYQVISKIEQQLLAQFHNLTFFQNRLSVN
ncbi:MAG: hypothetical protein QNJ18_23620, partial [Xenococcaceae cyanobacterium MO_167.B52]|nr:hypothetical protein [Xenococcaceae cyanobacterium MO_167.B52]